MGSYQSIEHLAKLIAQHITVISIVRIRFFFQEWHDYMLNVKGINAKELYNVAQMAYHSADPIKYLKECDLFQIPIYMLDDWEIIQKTMPKETI